MPALAIDKSALSHLLASNVIDFLDLGCSTGKSYEYIRKATGQRIGLSLDTDAAKVAECRKVNDLSFVFDATSLPRSIGTVSSAFMIHFLEHLPNADMAMEIIRGAICATRDFVMIRQPFFDHDEALRALGLKTYWSDWSGHKNLMHSGAIAALAGDPLVGRLRTFGIDRIAGSEHPAVLPLRSLPDQHDYQAEKHGPKPTVAFGFDCFRELLVIFERDTISDKASVAIARILSGLEARSELLADLAAEPVEAPRRARA